MRIHHLLFAFLLVLLSPLAAFIQIISSIRGVCWGQCVSGTREIGMSGLRSMKCCIRK
uniref:Uncharacterized protein n=1 Tax=Mus spicilegus TaxID=10103 RepID=A0A8C6GBR8_MUSSI